MNKKTEVITFRTDSETKSKLAKIAEDHDWSIAQVVDKICRKYFETDPTDENKKSANQKRHRRIPHAEKRGFRDTGTGGTYNK